MRSSVAVLLLGLAALPLFARRDQLSVAAIISCGNGVPGGINCAASNKDLKEARSVYARGLKLANHKEFDEAFVEFDDASRLSPGDLQFFFAREVAKSQLVFQRSQRGDTLLSAGLFETAAIEFRLALDLDPDNDYLKSRLTEAQRSASPAKDDVIPASGDSAEFQVSPNSERATFHYRGDVRGLFKQLAASYGIAAEFDNSVPTTTVRFDVDDVDFFTAIGLGCQVSKTMWTPLDPHGVLIVANTPDNHKQFDQVFLKTFRVPGAGTAGATAEFANTLRSICDLQQIGSEQSGTFEVRAPRAALAACTKLVQQLDRERPQVVLDVEVYRIDHNFTREIGVHVPDTFNMYNLASVAAAVSSGQSVATLVSELASGSTSNNSALTALLTQLETQTGIFRSPLAHVWQRRRVFRRQPGSFKRDFVRQRVLGAEPKPYDTAQRARKRSYSSHRRAISCSEFFLFVYRRFGRNLHLLGTQSTVTALPSVRCSEVRRITAINTVDIHEWFPST